MTIEEKILVTMGKRSNALNGLKGIRQAQVDLEDEQTFNNRFLFGDSNPDPGVIDIFLSYYIQAFYGNGLITETPAMNSLNNYSPWTNQMSKCVKSTGDGAGGIYPPTSEGYGQDNINTSSAWFRSNDVFVPDPPDDPQIYFGLDPYFSALASAGNAVIAKRNEQTPPDPGPVEDIHPDYFNDPHRATLLSAFQTLITQLGAWRDQVQDTIDMLNLANTTGIVFSEVPQMQADLPMSDVATMEALVITLNGYLSSYQAQHDYFIAFPASEDISGEPGYNQAAFNTNLTTTITSLNSTVTATIDSRVSAIPAILGSTSYPYSGMRKWRYFWISENVAKPQSPYVSLYGIGNALSQSQNGLNQANVAMSVFAPDSAEYYQTPQLISAYLDNPVFDVGGALVSGDAHLIWIGDPSANKYKIYRKLVADVLLNNDNWTDGDLLIWQSLPAEGMIYMEYLDETVVFNEGYVYRVQTHDTNQGTAGQDRIDSFDSSSLQSEIFDLNSTITIDTVTEIQTTDPIPVTTALQLTLSETVTLSAGAFIALLTGTRQGLYRVLEVKDNLVTIKETDPTGVLGSTMCAVVGSRFMNYS